MIKSAHLLSADTAWPGSVGHSARSSLNCLLSRDLKDDFLGLLWLCERALAEPFHLPLDVDKDAVYELLILGDPLLPTGRYGAPPSVLLLVSYREIVTEVAEGLAFGGEFLDRLTARFEVARYEFNTLSHLIYPFVGCLSYKEGR